MPCATFCSPSALGLFRSGRSSCTFTVRQVGSASPGVTWGEKLLIAHGLGRARVPRIVTYNVHRCVGIDGRLSPRRIADVLAACEPDIVALQELDVRRARTGLVDQAHEIAFDLEMDMHFHPAFTVMEEAYGDAVLTSYPLRLIKAGPLPGLARLPGLEPRGALWAAIDVGGAELQV